MSLFIVYVLSEDCDVASMDCPSRRRILGFMPSCERLGLVSGGSFRVLSSSSSGSEKEGTHDLGQTVLFSDFYSRHVGQMATGMYFIRSKWKW